MRLGAEGRGASRARGPLKYSAPIYIYIYIYRERERERERGVMWRRFFILQR